MPEPSLPKILVVDDKPANLQALRRLFTVAGVNAEIWLAASGNEALALALEHEFALLLLDVDMPDMDGYEVAELLKGVEGTQGQPIIFITAAYQDHAHKLKGYGSGAVDYLEKPIDDAILLSKLAVFLELYNNRKALEASVVELAAANQQLREEIERRKKIETALRASESRSLSLQAELERLNANLEQRIQEECAANRAKDHLLIQQSRLAGMGEMVHNIAHQWRQPLNALGIIINNIKDDYDYGELDAERLQDAVAKSQRLLERMSVTVDEFRNFFRPDSEPAEFDLAEPVRDALFIIGDSLKNNGIAVDVQLQPGLCGHGYPNQFAQAVLNLLANAKEAILERDHGGGRIVIGLERQGDEGVLNVADNAGGIAQAVLPRIFEPYFTTKPQGSGIGLYMTKMIVERNFKGRIEVANRDGGAVFTVAVPLLADVEHERDKPK